MFLYTGLDRFSRVQNQNYLNTGTAGGSTDRFQYGYDANSNAMYRKNLVRSANSELYHANGTGAGYDNLNRMAIAPGVVQCGYLPRISIL
jgi:hypothetical protein